MLSDPAYLRLAATFVATFGMLFAFIAASSLVTQEQCGKSNSDFAAFCHQRLVDRGLRSGELTPVGRVSPASLLESLLVLQMLAVLSLVVAVGASGLPPGWLIQVLTGCASITVVPTMANTSAVALARHPFNAGTAAALFGSGSSQARA